MPIEVTRALSPSKDRSGCHHQPHEQDSGVTETVGPACPRGSSGSSFPRLLLVNSCIICITLAKLYEEVTPKAVEHWSQSFSWICFLSMLLWRKETKQKKKSEKKLKEKKKKKPRGFAGFGLVWPRHWCRLGPTVDELPLSLPLTPDLPL